MWSQCANPDDHILTLSTKKETRINAVFCESEVQDGVYNISAVPILKWHPLATLPPSLWYRAMYPNQAYLPFVFHSWSFLYQRLSAYAAPIIIHTLRTAAELRPFSHKLLQHSLMIILPITRQFFFFRPLSPNHKPAQSSRPSSELKYKPLLEYDLTIIALQSRESAQS